MNNEQNFGEETLSFEKLNINEDIIKGLKDIGYTEPTPLQKSVIPVALEKKDVIVKARSGMGKNGSFIIPVLQRVAGRDKREGTHALILTPEVEDARKIDEMIWAIGYHAQIESAVVDMKGDFDEQTAAVKEEPEVVVANPGRIAKILSDNRLIFKHIDVLVIDEADKLEKIGITDQVKKVLERVSGSPQTLFYAADFSKEVIELAKYQVKGEALYIGFDVFKDVNELEDVANIGSDSKQAENGQADRSESKSKSSQKQGPKSSGKESKGQKGQEQSTDDRSKSLPSHLKQIKQGYIHVPGRKKISTLMSHLENSPSESVIIFTASKRGTDRLYKVLRKNDKNATSIFKKLSDRKKDERLEGFKQGNYNYLLVADFTADQLGLNKVQQVVNYDVPNEVEDYVGRTYLLKDNKKGQMVSLVSKQDRDDIEQIKKEVDPTPSEWKLPKEVKQKDKKDDSGKKRKSRRDKDNRKKRPSGKKERKSKKGGKDDDLQLPQPSYDKLSGGRKGHEKEEKDKDGIFGFVKKLFSD